MGGDQDDALPVDNFSASQSQGLSSKIARMLETPWFEFCQSMVMLVILMNNREAITPDFAHFITCMVEDEVHFICVMLYWLLWKCFLVPDPIFEKMKDDASKNEHRIKVVARAFLELTLSLALLNQTFDSFYPWIYCYSLLTFVAFRSIYYEKIDLTVTIFVVLYFCQNFLVNMIDFVVNKHMLGFYNDELFHRMFSYKIFQTINCFIVSFVFAQILHPTIETVAEYPQVLYSVFRLTIPCNLLMLITFLVELTFYD